MHIEIFPSGPVQTNTLLLICDATKEAAIVDPSLGAGELLIAYANNHDLNVGKILLTHSHWDHIADLKLVSDRFNAEIYVHPSDAGNIENPGSDGLSAPIPIEAVAPTHQVREGERISVGKSVWQVIETPGHTPGGICFYNAKEGILISGDTLFQHSYGRLDLPTATPTAMISSLEKLATLPPSTVVYPGHGPRTTIGEEEWIKNPRKSLKF